MPLEDTAEPAEVLSLSPGTCQRGCRETQRQVSILAGRDGSLSTAEEPSLASAQRRVYAAQVFTDPRLQTGVPGDGCAVCEVKESLLLDCLKLHWKRTWAWMLHGIHADGRLFTEGHNSFFQASELTTAFR